MMTAAEKDELLTLLFSGDKPEIAIGQPGGHIGDGLWFAIEKIGGGITMKACSPRAAVLIDKLLEGGEDASE